MPKKRKSEIKWDDNAVAEELINEFGEEYTDEITESLSLVDGPYSSYGPCGKFTVGGDDYALIQSINDAENIALMEVRHDLGEEPELFDPDFIKKYLIISDRRIIAQEMADSYVDDLDDDRIIEEADMLEEYDNAEDSAKDDVVEEAREKLRDSLSEQTEEELKDPIKYFVRDQGLYSLEELVKQPFIMIDTDEAAADAILEDGWEHFLSHYDGNYETTNNGLVYFRE